jgi:hypothetical protein
MANGITADCRMCRKHRHSAAVAATSATHHEYDQFTAEGELLNVNDPVPAIRSVHVGDIEA